MFFVYLIYEMLSEINGTTWTANKRIDEGNYSSQK